MKALAIDCAVSKIAIAGKHDGNTVSLSYDIGIRQSEKLLPAIDFVMRELQLPASQLKALNLAYGIPVYGIPSLEAYAYPFWTAESLLSVIASKEEEFFFQFFSKGKALTDADDKPLASIAGLLDPEGRTLVVGPAAAAFVEAVEESFPLLRLDCFDRGNPCVESLFILAERKIASGEPPLADYDGPLYVRQSEAELALKGKKAADAGA